MIYREREYWVAAYRWWANGDHPLDHTDELDTTLSGDTYFRTEGAIVGLSPYSRDIHGSEVHDCGSTYADHGRLKDPADPQHMIVCPGDYIVDTPHGYINVGPEQFEDVYEPDTPPRGAALIAYTCFLIVIGATIAAVIAVTFTQWWQAAGWVLIAATAIGNYAISWKGEKWELEQT